MKKIMRFIGVIIFILILYLINLRLEEVFIYKTLDGVFAHTRKLGGFFNYEEDLDMVYFGSSHAYTSFIPELIDGELGTRSYVMASQLQPIDMTYYFVKEALDRHDLDYLVVDVHKALGLEEESDSSVHSALDVFPRNLNRFSMVMDTVSNKRKAQALFPIIKYHDRWTELSDQDWETKYSDYKDPIDRGFVRLNYQTDEFRYVPEKAKYEIEETINNYKYLVKMDQLARKKGAKLILVKTPVYDYGAISKQLDMLEAVLAEYNIELVDFNKIDMGLEMEDFHDLTHLRYSGSQIFSREFAKYMKNYLD